MTDIDQETQQIVPKITWDEIRLDYLNTNLEAALKPQEVQSVTLKFLATKYGKLYGTLRNIAGEQNWTGQLTLMIQQQKEALKERVIHINLQSEVEVRTRQISYGRIAQDVAMDALLAMDPAKLSPLEITQLLKLGTEIERKAAGMEDQYTPPKTDMRDNQTREAVRQTMTALQTFRDRLRLKNASA